MTGEEFLLTHLKDLPIIFNGCISCSKILCPDLTEFSKGEIKGLEYAISQIVRLLLDYDRFLKGELPEDDIP